MNWMNRRAGEGGVLPPQEGPGQEEEDQEWEGGALPGEEKVR